VKKINDVVTYIKGGIAIPAIVVKSESHPELISPAFPRGEEFLTLLYADHDSVTLVNAGRSKQIGDVDISVRPFATGRTNAWRDVAPDPRIALLTTDGKAKQDHITALEKQLADANSAIAEKDKQLADAKKSFEAQNAKISELSKPQENKEGN
jgi:hypothetical protein